MAGPSRNKQRTRWRRATTTMQPKSRARWWNSSTRSVMLSVLIFLAIQAGHRGRGYVSPLPERTAPAAANAAAAPAFSRQAGGTQDHPFGTRLNLADGGGRRASILATGPEPAGGGVVVAAEPSLPAVRKGGAAGGGERTTGDSRAGSPFETSSSGPSPPREGRRPNVASSSRQTPPPSRVAGRGLVAEKYEAAVVAPSASGSYYGEGGTEGDQPPNGDESCVDDDDDVDVVEAGPREVDHDDEDDETARRLAQTAKAAALLRRNWSGSLGTTGRATKAKGTGPRRVGSATKARGSDGSLPLLVDAIRAGNGVGAAPPRHDTKQTGTTDANNPGTNPTDDGTDPSQRGYPLGTSTSATLSRAMIEAAVDSMLQSAGSTMGLLGEAAPTKAFVQKPRPGSLLAKSQGLLNRYSGYGASGNIVVRVATPLDDLDVANLRLSVFSNFSPETRRVFCDRSCHLLDTRRQRGATCIVATNPRQQAAFLPPGGSDPVVGTAEISFHEFSQTSLGRARPVDSILYVTEVAVNTTFRRRGVARLMLEAIDKVATIRKAETIYLHVDVTNVGALRLYERGGYRKLPSDNPVYSEFTQTLNLHDGATKGRNHFLMAKDLRPPTWLRDISSHDQAVVVPAVRGTLGIEVTA